MRGASSALRTDGPHAKARALKQFREAFMRYEDAENPPAGMVRFNMIRNAQNPDEVVVCFGFLDGTVDEHRRVAAEQDYAAQVEAIAPFV
jgi:hypothetical protein